MGHGIGLAASVLLAGSMGARFAKTQKVMPAGAGIMSISEHVSMVYYVIHIPSMMTLSMTDNGRKWF